MLLLLTTGDNLQIATLIEIYIGMADKHTHMHTHTLAH